MRKLLVLVYIFIEIHIYAQQTKEKELEIDFVKTFCSCLQEYAKEKPDLVLYTFTPVCIRDYFNTQRDLFVAVVEEKYPNDTVHTDYEKGKMLGSELIHHTVETLVKDCSPYRQTLHEYKLLMKEQLKLKASKEEVIAKIKEVKQMEELLQEDKKIAELYSLLGVLYEFAEDKESALQHYDKSMNLYPTVAAKGLRALLKMNQ